MIKSLIDPELPQWKGNLHTHTVNSDGRCTPQEVVDQYAAAGYDFLSLTDHRKVTDPASVQTSLMLLPGLELDYVVKGRHRQAVHIIGVGVKADVMSVPSVLDSPQQGIDAIREKEGLAIFAHPAWSLNEPELIESLQGLSAVEIYNHVSDFPWNVARGDASLILDQCFSDGLLLPVIAADDAHHYDGDQCHSCLMVCASALSVENVLSALSQGACYATQGPRIHALWIEDGQMHIRCSPCERILFYTNRFHVAGRVVQGHALTEACYAFQLLETFVRVEITDEHGRKAWSSPCKIKHDPS